jgi:Uma2 family endonuclease
MRSSLKPKLDYSDYLLTPDDGNRYEILLGELLVSPPPSPTHQRVSKRLERQLETHFEGRSLGEVFNAPIGLILTTHDIAEPDLLVVTEPTQVSERGIEGPPLLVVEVFSPASRGRDTGVKARRYAELGIPHYWLVDPEARRIECLTLDRSAYRPSIAAEGDATLSHPAWPGLTIDLAEVWRTPG